MWGARSRGTHVTHDGIDYPPPRRQHFAMCGEVTERQAPANGPQKKRASACPLLLVLQPPSFSPNPLGEPSPAEPFSSTAECWVRAHVRGVAIPRPEKFLPALTRTDGSARPAAASPRATSALRTPRYEQTRKLIKPKIERASERARAK
eukprot:6177585-Pleurochrysis_carterae.AAC.3